MSDKRDFLILKPIGQLDEGALSKFQKLVLYI